MLNVFTGEHFTTAICGTVHNKDLLQHDIQMHTHTFHTGTLSQTHT